MLGQKFFQEQKSLKRKIQEQNNIRSKLKGTINHSYTNGVVIGDRLQGRRPTTTKATSASFDIMQQQNHCKKQTTNVCHTTRISTTMGALLTISSPHHGASEPQQQQFNSISSSSCVNKKRLDKAQFTQISVNSISDDPFRFCGGGSPEKRGKSKPHASKQKPSLVAPCESDECSTPDSGLLSSSNNTTVNNNQLAESVSQPLLSAQRKSSILQNSNSSLYIKPNVPRKTATLENQLLIKTFNSIQSSRRNTLNATNLIKKATSSKTELKRLVKKDCYENDIDNVLIMTAKKEEENSMQQTDKNILEANSDEDNTSYSNQIIVNQKRFDHKLHEIQSSPPKLLTSNCNDVSNTNFEQMTSSKNDHIMLLPNATTNMNQLIEQNKLLTEQVNKLKEKLVQKKEKINQVQQKAQSLSEQASQLRQELALLKQFAETAEQGFNTNLTDKKLAIGAYINLFTQKQLQKEQIIQQEYEKQMARVIAEKRDFEDRFLQMRIQQTEQLSEHFKATYSTQQELKEAKAKISKLEQTAVVHQLEKLSKAQVQIIELNEQLRQRAEGIVQLLDVVNKLQQQNQHNPEILNILSILKTLLYSNQQKFQTKQSQKNKNPQQKAGSRSQSPQNQNPESLEVEASTITFMSPRFAGSPEKDNYLHGQVLSQKTQAHTSSEILILDQQATSSLQQVNGDKQSNNNQVQSPPTTPSNILSPEIDQPRNQQTMDDFNTNVVRVKLEEVAIGRSNTVNFNKNKAMHNDQNNQDNFQEQQMDIDRLNRGQDHRNQHFQNQRLRSPEMNQNNNHLLSRIVRDGRDSNFFSSLVYDTAYSSPEEKLRQTQGLVGQQRSSHGACNEAQNNLIEFLMEKSTSTAVKHQDSIKSFKSSCSETIVNQKYQPPLKSIEKQIYYPADDGDSKKIMVQTTSRKKTTESNLQYPTSKNVADSKVKSIQISLDSCDLKVYNHKRQPLDQADREVILTESLENSPIKQINRSSVISLQKDSNLIPSVAASSQGLILRNLRVCKQPSGLSCGESSDLPPTNLDDGSLRDALDQDIDKKQEEPVTDVPHAQIDVDSTSLAQQDCEVLSITSQKKQQKQNQMSPSYLAAIGSFRESSGRASGFPQTKEPDECRKLTIHEESQNDLKCQAYTDDDNKEQDNEAEPVEEARNNNDTEEEQSIVTESGESQSTMHQNSLFYNSYTRQEVDMVLKTISRFEQQSAAAGGTTKLKEEADQQQQQIGFSRRNYQPRNDQSQNHLMKSSGDFEEDEEDYQPVINISELTDLVAEEPSNATANAACTNSMESSSIDSTLLKKINSNRQAAGHGGCSELKEVKEVDDEGVSQNSLTEEEAVVCVQEESKADSSRVVHKYSPSLLEDSKFDARSEKQQNQHQALNQSVRSDHHRAESILQNPFQTKTHSGLVNDSTDMMQEQNDQVVSNETSSVENRSDEQSTNNQNTNETKYKTLADYTKQANPSIKSESSPPEKSEKAPSEHTADFADRNNLVNITWRSDLHQTTIDSDKPVEPRNVNGSGFFSRDFRVLQNATYGTIPDQGLMILRKLKEEEEEQEADEHDQQVAECAEMSFAEPQAPEPELSVCSVDADLLLQKDNFQMMVMPNYHQASASINQSIASYQQDQMSSMCLDNMMQQNGSLINNSIVSANQLQLYSGSMAAAASNQNKHERTQSVRTIGTDQQQQQQIEEEEESDGVPKVEDMHD